MNLYEKTILKVSHYEENTTLLGPYNRFVIWVHGCCFNCEGCLAVNSKNGVCKEIDINELANKIVESGCEGITISGGEPFLQVYELIKLIRLVKEKRDVGIIIYSGFTIEEIRRDENKEVLLSLIDILIDGRYIKELDDGKAYIGSSNQSLIYLSQRYKTIGEKYYSETNRKAEIKFYQNQVVLIGVPSNNVLEVWKKLKEKNGGMRNDF